MVRTLFIITLSLSSNGVNRKLPGCNFARKEQISALSEHLIPLQPDSLIRLL
jgi:hypothetical protein